MELSGAVSATSGWKSTFPGAVVGVLAMRRVGNPDLSPALELRKRDLEQTLRAVSLQQRYGFGRIAEDDLTPEKLAAATTTAVQRGRFKADGLQFDGAARTSRILVDLLDARG